MAKSKIFGAASIGLALAAGCSSSTPNSTAHDAGETSDATTPPPNPGISQSEAAVGLNPGMGSPGNCTLGGSECPMGQQCCLPSFLAGSGTCMDPSMCMTGTVFQCMSAAGCSGSQVCCGMGGGGGGFSLRCVAPGSCMGIQLCDSSHTCPANQPCVSPPAMGGPMSMTMFCNNGMFGMFGARDGGPPPASDGGSPSDGSSASDASQTTPSDGATEAASDGASSD